jgi:hypothetical protein
MAHKTPSLMELTWDRSSPTQLNCILETGGLSNIGAADRLDFTVIRPAVNLVSRIEAVAKTLDLPIVVSAEFARAYGGPLRSLGSHQLRGLAKPHELFAPAVNGSLAAGIYTSAVVFILETYRSRRRRRHSNRGKTRKLCKLPTRELTEPPLPASDSSPNQADKQKYGRSGIRPWQEIWHRRSPRPRSSSRPSLNLQSYTSDLRNLLEP